MPLGHSPLLQLALADTSTICLRCARKLARSSLQTRRTISISTPIKQTARAHDLDSRYFWGNDFRDGKAERYNEARKSWQSLKAQGTRRIQLEKTSSTSTDPPPVPTPPASSSIPANTAVADAPPIPRRRARLKDDNGNPSSPSDSAVTQLPPDASATLSLLASSSKGLRRRLATYLALTKPRLAFLVVLTTTASYSLYPVPSLLSTSATHTPSLSTLTLLFLTTGTFSVIASANTLNMLFEPAHDAKMSRTRNRPLVRGLIKPRSALLFAIATAVAGTGILYYGVNPTTAALGAGNIVLYAFIYTPMKRLSVTNTWVGAIVGAIPPLMGWCAAGGQYAIFPSAAPTPTFLEEFSTLLFTPQATGGWLLAALLFAWQFPHFNALSHPIRTEYASAGYRMMASYYPRLNTRVALRYSVLMFPICVGLSYTGITDRGFVVTSSVVNAWMVREAWRFWRSGGGEGGAAAKSARGLFWASVWHLPIVLVLALVHKNGLWEGVWNGLFGEGQGDEEDEWEYEDE